MGKEKAKAAKRRTLSVYLNEEQIRTVEEIAAWSGQSRHAVLQHAIRELIRDWEAGRRPETITKTILK